MKDQYLLGFDLGTYEAKGALCRPGGEVVATAACKYRLRIPQIGYAEHSPMDDWWKSFRSIVSELLQKTGIEPKSIAGIGCSAVAVGATPVDEKCDPLRNAILYGVDTRSQRQADELNQAIGKDTLQKVCGAECSVESYGPKLLWIRENEPEIYRKTKKFTFSPGFITARLTGRYAIDVYSLYAAGQPLFNKNTLDWDDSLCGHVTSKDRLPEVMKATDLIGAVTKEAAAETGLCEGTPVICGTTDAAAEAFSVGVMEPGDTMVMYGSTIFVNHLTDHVPPGNPLWQSKYVFGDSMCVLAGMSSAGSLTRWVRDTMAKDLVGQEAAGTNSYDALFAEAGGARPGANGLFVLPYFSGERLPIRDPAAKGMIFGLTLSHTRGDIMRASLEGIGYGLCQILDIMRSMGYRLDRVKAVGGGTKSREWMQIMSDVCGMTQEIPKVSIGASFGDALLAGIGIGVVTSPLEIRSRMQMSYRTEPNPECARLYAQRKQTFAELYRLTKGLMHK